MDDKQFDQIARLTGDAVTRRRAMRGGVAGLMAAAGFRTAAAEDAPIDPLGCKGESGKCKKNGDCCKGLKCANNGTCKYPQGCGTKDDYCEKNNDCCNKFTCDTNKRKCVSKNGCGKKGDFCNNNNDCCNKFTCKKNKNKCVKKN